MSSSIHNTNSNSSVNNYINPKPNTEVRLAYYTYTWDYENNTSQRTGWSSIGSYYLNDNNDVVYTNNMNQLIKTAGSYGVAVVDNTLGVIANIPTGQQYNDAAPIILRADGQYIAGLDNVNIRTTSRNGNVNLHTYLNQIDLHFIETYNELNNHSIIYKNLWNETVVNSTYSELHNTDNLSSLLSISTSNRGTITENTHVILVGESGGINKIENTGFIYNNLEYKRRYNTIDTWMRLYDIVGTWTYASNGFSITINSGDNTTGNTISFGSYNNILSTITQVTDADIIKIGTIKQEFSELYSNLSSVYADNPDELTNYQTSYSAVLNILSSTEKGIDIILGNTPWDGKDNSSNYYATVLQAPITFEIFTSVSNALAVYSNVSNVGDLYIKQKSAIVVDKIPWNSTFIDINTNNTATAFAVINDRTKTWSKINFPTIDETWKKVMDSLSVGDDKNYYYNNSSNYYNLINQYPITADANNFSNNNIIEYISSIGKSIKTVNVLNLGTSDDPTSYSYMLLENNLINSANNFRFIGLKTKNNWDLNSDQNVAEYFNRYSNSEGSNILEITGFNKILLSDLYENPNNYQIPTVTYYWNSSNDVISSGSTNNVIDIPVNEGISYAMSIQSALTVNGNFLVAGVGQASGTRQTGYNGVFYIPLPNNIDQNEDASYKDTHWMLTTYTPQVNNRATNINLPNSGHVLYKYTKMNDLITTGVYGGFTPYYNPSTNKVAGLVNIPQVSYNTGEYTVNNIIYASAAENQAAKISSLISNIVYIAPCFDKNNITFSNALAQQVTSNSDKCCIITLNSYEAAIIDDKGWMINNNIRKGKDGNGGSTDTMNGKWIGNIMYLNLFGYDDGEWNNLSFDVNRKYIFTFNCHIQATNLNLVSDQIDYGTPSLLLVGHFRQRYCKSALTNGVNNTQVYAGETKLIPLLNKPLENPVNNIYNIEGTYTLSWNTTGTESIKAMTNNYTFYIPEEYNKPFMPSSSNFETIYQEVFKINSNGVNNNVKPIGNVYENYNVNNFIYTPFNNNMNTTVTYSNTSNMLGNSIEFINTLDRIYAFILVGPNVNPNIKYQFVNNTMYQSNNNQILSRDDLNLFAGINITGDDTNSVDLSAFDINKSLGIDSGIIGINEPMFSMVIQRY